MYSLLGIFVAVNLALTIVVTVIMLRGGSMKLVAMCSVLAAIMFVGNANAMVYERVIKVTNDQVIRSWSARKPKCSEVVNDCINVVKKSSTECVVRAEQLKSSEKCF